VAFVAPALAVAVGAFELRPGRLAFSRDDRLSGPLIAASLAAVTLVAFASGPRGSTPFVVAATSVLAAGVALRIAAMRTLRGDYSYVARAPAAVCTRGAYRFVRHPAYLGTCLYALAAPLAFESLAAAAVVPLALLAVAYRIRLEEALLAATRPSYVEYSARTAALIPFVL
jgi:protein-S-isoprenylcysteine O-methyltransferase Ste14